MLGVSVCVCTRATYWPHIQKEILCIIYIGIHWIYLYLSVLVFSALSLKFHESDESGRLSVWAEKGGAGFSWACSFDEQSALHEKSDNYSWYETKPLISPILDSNAQVQIDTMLLYAVYSTYLWILFLWISQDSIQSSVWKILEEHTQISNRK